MRSRVRLNKSRKKMNIFGKNIWNIVYCIDLTILSFYLPTVYYFKECFWFIDCCLMSVIYSDLKISRSQVRRLRKSKIKDATITNLIYFIKTCSFLCQKISWYIWNMWLMDIIHLFLDNYNKTKKEENNDSEMWIK